MPYVIAFHQLEVLVGIARFELALNGPKPLVLPLNTIFRYKLYSLNVKLARNTQTIRLFIRAVLTLANKHHEMMYRSGIGLL